MSVAFVAGMAGAASAQYCDPEYDYDCADGDAIHTFTLTGANSTSFNDVATGCSFFGYDNRTAQPAIDLLAGGTYSGTVNSQYDGSFGGSDYVAVWIDFNNNEVFESTELVGTANDILLATENYSITIPSGSLPGVHRMRVRMAYETDPLLMDPCSLYAYGEVHDYTVNVIDPGSCSTVPAITLTASSASVCPGQSFDLTVDGVPVLSGFSYTWESSINSGGSWDPLPSATGVTQTVQTDYRVTVTCAAGGSSETSNTVTVGINPPNACYCTPQYTDGCYFSFFGIDFYIDIDDLSLIGENGTTLSSVNTGCAANLSLEDLTADDVDLAEGGTYTIDITSNDYGLGARAWIDFDDDGVFSASEAVGDNGVESSGYTFSFAITIPAGAPTVLGSHRMRVRLAYEDPTLVDPCALYDFGEAHDYTVNIIVPPTCPAPTGLMAAAATATTANIGWAAVGAATEYEYVVDQSSASPSGSGTIATGTSAVASVSGNMNYLHVRANCGGGSYSGWATISFIMNDEPAGAAILVAGTPCSGGIANGTLAGATAQTGEPEIACGYDNFTSTWYQFAAPASGMVRISTDYSVSSTDELTDTKVGLFSAVDPTDYSTFQLLACDEDNGVLDANPPFDESYRSIVYAADLTPGTTYYIKVDRYDVSSPGNDFCVDVMPIDNTMISAQPNCGGGSYFPMSNYDELNHWISLVDEEGKIVANLNANGNTIGGVEAQFNINAGALRYDGTIPYLDRNFLINTDDVPATPVGVQFFFLNTELTALGAPLGSLNVSRQSGADCNADFDIADGSASLLTQTGNGTVNGASFVEVATPEFSNFYIHAGVTPLAIELKDISAINVGQRNRVDFTTAKEQKGDYFIVERSLDGVSFSAIGRVDAKGQPSSYSFWDEAPVTGVNYYQLKMMDVSGKFTYSNKVSATVKADGIFAVEAYPNPVSEVLTVRVHGQISANAVLSVTDVTGKVMKMMDVKGADLKVNMKDLASGIYLIRYTDNDHSQTIKVNKQ